MHKVDLVCRLTKSEPHNAAHYQEQLNQQLTRHDDVIHHLVDIMKTDDYFRQTEDLPQIDPLTAHEEIAKFPELWMEEIFVMARTHKRNARNELIYNSGGSVQKTLYSLLSDALEDKICDLLLHNVHEAVSRVATEVDILERHM